MKFLREVSGGGKATGRNATLHHKEKHDDDDDDDDCTVFLHTSTISKLFFFSIHGTLSCAPHIREPFPLTLHRLVEIVSIPS